MTSSYFLVQVALAVASSSASVRAEVTGADVFVKGAALVGGSNGMFFDAENNLYVAQVLGRTISVIDPENGNVLDQLGMDDGIFFPDDVTVGPDGDVYWTDVLGGTVGTRPLGGNAEILYPYGTYPNSNPVTLSDDGRRLFFAQCFNLDTPNGLYKRDLVTNETTAIVEGVPSCATNAMDFRNESLFSPILFEGRVARINLENNNQVTNVTTNIGVPVAVKFDSQGRLHALDTSNGQVLRIDLDSPDVTNNTELVAQLPFDGLDNLAFDNDDRLFVSSFSRGTVWEVLGMNDFRTVSAGSFSITSGVAVLNDILYTVHPLAVHGYDIDTAEEVSFVEAIPGLSELMQPAAVVATDENKLVILSFLTNSLIVWDIATESAVLTTTFEAPTDAHPYLGGLLVVEAATGNVIHATGDDLSNRTVLIHLPGVFFLAGSETDVYATHTFNGTTLQIISNGTVMVSPKVVSSGHNSPEGIAFVGDYLLVVSAGGGTLDKVDIATGEISTLVEGLECLPPLSDFGIVFGFTNDVAVNDGYAYVNADGTNAIYKVNLDSSTDDSTSGAQVLDGGAIMNLCVVGAALVYFFGLE